MELELKTYTNDQLAEWFGVKAESFRRMKKKKLIELKNYAEFYEDKGRVTITRIFEPCYCKNKGDKKIIKTEFKNTWYENGYDTCSRVGRAIYDKFNLTIVEDTAIEYTRQTRNEYFGSPKTQTGGELGKCYYVWCKVLGPQGFMPLNEDELKIKKKCASLCFRRNEDADIHDDAIVLEQLRRRGEINSDEAWQTLMELEQLNDLTAWRKFESMMEEEIGYKVILATKVEYYSEKSIPCGRVLIGEGEAREN